MTIFSALLVAFGIDLLTRYRKDRISKLRGQLFKVSTIALKNSSEEKAEETLSALKEIAKDK